VFWIQTLAVVRSGGNIYKPSNGSGLGWVDPGHSLGWVGFLGLGSGLSFVGLGRVEVSQTRVTQRTHLISVSFVLL